MLGSVASAGVGGGLGGLLGQVGDTLSAPRRTLWSMLGLPEQGSELVGNLTGLDSQGALAQALGFGAEMAGDPLMYAGGLLGPLARMGMRGMRGAGAGAEVAGELAGGAGQASRYMDPAIGRGITPMGGWPEAKAAVAGEGYVPPRQFMGYPKGVADYEGIPQQMYTHPAIGKNPLDAIHADFEAQAAQQAAQQAAGDPMQQMLGQGSGRRPGMNDLSLPQVHGQYGDLMEDLASGRMNPEDALRPRVEMLSRLGELEARAAPARDSIPRFAENQHLFPDNSRLAEESALMAELLQPRFNAQQSLLRGVSLDEGMTLHEALNKAHGNLLAGVPEPYAVGQGSQLYPPTVDALQGLLPPESLPKLMQGLEGLHLPLDRGAMGNAYLDAMHENLSEQLPRHLLDILQGHAEPPPGWMEELGGAGQGLHERMVTMGQQWPHMGMPGGPQDPLLQSATSPLLQEILAHIRQRAGIQ